MAEITHKQHEDLENDEDSDFETDDEIDDEIDGDGDEDPENEHIIHGKQNKVENVNETKDFNVKDHDNEEFSLAIRRWRRNFVNTAVEDAFNNFNTQLTFQPPSVIIHKFA